MNQIFKKIVVTILLCSIAFLYGGVVATQPTQKAAANWVADWEQFADSFLDILLDTILELISKIVIAKTLDAIEQKITDAIYAEGGIIDDMDAYLHEHLGETTGDLMHWYAENCFSIDLEFLDFYTETSKTELSDCPPVSGEGKFAKAGFTLEMGDDNVTDIDLSMEDYLKESIGSNSEEWLNLAYKSQEAEQRELENRTASKNADGSVAIKDSEGKTKKTAGSLTYRQQMAAWAKQRVLTDSKNIIVAVLTPLLEKATDEFLDSTINQGTSSGESKYTTDYMNKWKSYYKDKYSTD